VQPDHVHVFLSFPPVVSISVALKKLKGITARKLFNVGATTIKKYIERMEHLKGRR
jgi:putative transposase